VPAQNKVFQRAAVVCLLVLTISFLQEGIARGVQKSSAQIVTGQAKDALGRPAAKVTVILQAPSGADIASTMTDEQGLFVLNGVPPGTYVLLTRKKGYKPAAKVVVISRRASNPVDLVLESEKPLTVVVKAKRLRAQNGVSSTGTNKYTLTQRDIDDLPEGQATPLNEVLLQMPGVALDQNQEIHIRGEHAGIQYQMNGVLLPLDINNDPTFTQLLNAHFVKSISLIDGVLPAQYGYRTAGVIEIETKDGCEGVDNEFTILGGQRDTAQPSFEVGGCHGNLSYYLTGVYLRSNLGLNSATSAPDPIHDHTDQGQGFAYLTYAVNPTTRLSLISGMTVATNQFPNVPNEVPMFVLKGANPANYPSSAIDSSLDQQDYYGVLALDGVIGLNSDYQLAYSSHYNRENFNPDFIPDLIYQGVAPTIFTSDFSNSLQGDLSYRWGQHLFRTGFYCGEYAVEGDDTSLAFPIKMNIPQETPTSITANFNKINLVYGVYLQDTWQMTETLSVNYGSRWDRADGFVNDSQFSPTINFIYKPLVDTTLHAGFARNFQVPNFQNVSSGITALQNTTGGVGPGISLSTKLDAETDYTWDVGYAYQLMPNLVITQDSYFRIDRHYIDEGQFGFVPLDAPFNYVRGYGAGLENSVSYNLENLALRFNIFVAREEVRGVATGQYNFPPVAQLQYIDRHYIILDHTPLVGASGGAAYRWRAYQFTFDGLFSSGLRGGFANQSQLPKVWQFNLSAARFFEVARIGKIENRIILENIFDRTNLIRPATGIGVFQSAYGPRITVYDALTIPLPSF
jgi:outer membrane receptor protein involved in Fe transport